VPPPIAFHSGSVFFILICNIFKHLNREWVSPEPLAQGLLTQKDGSFKKPILFCTRIDDNNHEFLKSGWVQIYKETI
jgi:hypothetical protein